MGTMIDESRQIFLTISFKRNRLKNDINQFD